QTASPKDVTASVNIKQKPKTYSIQLSALTGDDAEKRARSMVDKLQKKYGSHFVFKIQPDGKFYKIIVTNIPDEKTARESLKILSQEPDFKKAFIVKPQK
ncbi:MAG: SPOR domain-containing protein, partial [Candidatus Hydrogenedens sp.]